MADILTAVKEAIQSYWGKAYSRSSFNDMWILKCCKDVLDNLNSLSFFGNFVCPNMWLFYTTQIIIMWECIQMLKMSVRTQLSSKWKETLQIDSIQSLISVFYFFKHEKRQNALHWFTTKLVFRIDDTTVEFIGHIC